MFTPKEIRDTEFERVSKGYKVEDVDGFLARLADQIEHLMIDKNESDQKLMMLAEKVEQYRRDEDALRSALISAERMKESILAEATQQKDIMLRDAQQKAEKIVYEAESKIDREEVTLNALKQQVAAFKSEVLSIYKSHLEILSDLPDNPDEMNFGNSGVAAPGANAAAAPGFNQVFEPFQEMQAAPPAQAEGMNPAPYAPAQHNTGQVDVNAPAADYSGQFDQITGQVPYGDVQPPGLEPDARYETFSPTAYGNAEAPYAGGQPAAVEQPQMEESVFASFSATDEQVSVPAAEDSRFGRLDFGENFSFGRD